MTEDTTQNAASFWGSLIRYKNLNIEFLRPNSEGGTEYIVSVDPEVGRKPWKGSTMAAYADAFVSAAKRTIRQKPDLELLAALDDNQIKIRLAGNKKSCGGCGIFFPLESDAQWPKDTDKRLQPVFAQAHEEACKAVDELTSPKVNISKVDLTKPSVKPAK